MCCMLLAYVLHTPCLYAPHLVAMVWSGDNLLLFVANDGVIHDIISTGTENNCGIEGTGDFIVRHEGTEPIWNAEGIAE